MVTITQVTPRSLAEKADVRVGDILISINSHSISDVLDYRFYLAEREVTLLLHRGAELVTVSIKKGEYDDVGLGFESGLMDEKRRCKNKCIFCFIDQNPRGLRDSLYFKDDDSRLSFLHGNYVTLTNLTDYEVERIISMRLTPINVSVQTTSPELRVKMMGNPRAGDSLCHLRRLCEAGITVNAQVVLCRGVNDGAELSRTMRELAALYPALNSVSIVPAGLTAHREGLYKLEPFTAEECRDIIAQIDAEGDSHAEKTGARLFYAADEFYISGGVSVPDEDYYDGYPQIENGVGLIASLRGEIEFECEALPKLNFSREISIATGAAAYGFISEIADKLVRLRPKLKLHVHKVDNRLYGSSVTVAGLICGRDLIDGLRGKPLGEYLLIPSVMLDADGEYFLDNLTVADVERELGIPVSVVRVDGHALVEAIMKK